MLKQAKVQLVTDLTPRLKNSTCVVLVNFAGLSVSLQQKLKSELKANGAEMIVVKNTLIKRAGIEAKLDEKALTDEVLSGQTALIITEGDAVAPIQVLGKFTKLNQVPQFKVGIVEGSFQDAASLNKLSSLPNKDVLLSQVLGSLMSPAYGLVGVLQGNLQKLIYIIDQRSIALRDVKEVSTRG